MVIVFHTKSVGDEGFTKMYEVIWFHLSKEGPVFCYVGFNDL